MGVRDSSSMFLLSFLLPNQQGLVFLNSWLNLPLNSSKIDPCLKIKSSQDYAKSNMLMITITSKSPTFTCDFLKGASILNLKEELLTETVIDDILSTTGKERQQGVYTG